MTLVFFSVFVTFPLPKMNLTYLASYHALPVTMPLTSSFPQYYTSENVIVEVNALDISKGNVNLDEPITFPSSLTKNLSRWVTNGHRFPDYWHGLTDWRPYQLTHRRSDLWRDGLFFNMFQIFVSNSCVQYFLGSGPDRGRSPVEWGVFPFIHSFVPPLGSFLYEIFNPYLLTSVLSRIRPSVSSV